MFKLLKITIIEYFKTQFNYKNISFKIIIIFLIIEIVIIP